MTTSNLFWFINISLAQISFGQNCALLASEPSAWFRFDEPRFKAGNFTLVPGQVGKALQLDGKQNFVEVPGATPGVDVGDGDFTIELWVRIGNNKTIQNIVDKRDTSAKGFLIYTTRGRPGFQVTGETPIDAIVKDSLLADLKWHHVAGVVKRLPPQPIKVYVDGKLVGHSARNAPLQNLNNKVPMWIGRHHRNDLVDRDNIFFMGSVDELSIFKRALSDAEILSIFQAGSKGKCKSQKN